MEKKMNRNNYIDEEVIRKNNSRFEEPKPQPKNKISCSCSGCLWVIAMGILIGILIQECRRSTTRLELEKQLQEQFQRRQTDSLLNIKEINIKGK